MKLIKRYHSALYSLISHIREGNYCEDQATAIVLGHYLNYITKEII